MTLTEFDQGLLRWGAHLEDWPPVQRQHAQELLAGSAEARELLAEFVALNETLGTAMAVDNVDGAFVARVQSAVGRRIEGPSLWSLLPVGKIIGFGSLAGLGGTAAAMLLPAGVNMSALLVIALGGGLP